MLLGAGASRACGLPDLLQLQDLVLDSLSSAHEKYFRTQLEGRNLEGALSRLRRIRALLSGESEIEGLTAAKAFELDRAVCAAIVDQLSLKNANLDPVENLARWMRRSNYLRPIELFTVNYDLLIETALDRNRVLYFDGFSGNLEARFQTSLVEGDFITNAERIPGYFARFWKLHGSVNWIVKKDGTICRVGYSASGDDVAAIYPSDLKYDESRRVPFVVLQDRFRRALLQPETLLLVAGYSFSDDHLDELIFDAIATRQRSEVIVFCFGGLPEKLKQRAQEHPNFQIVTQCEAIIAGRLGPWKAADNSPSAYWDGAELALPDFAKLTHYLSRAEGPAALPLDGLEALPTVHANDAPGPAP